MSDRLTAGGEALVAEYHGRMHEDGCECSADFIATPVRAIEAEAAARAVDEALSVLERLVAAQQARWDASVWDEDATGTELDRAYDAAAALVAHLRGPR